MLNYHDLYELVARLDATSGVWEPRIGRWRAWPAAKMALVWHMMSRHEATLYSGVPQSFANRVARRLPKYGPAIGAALWQWWRNRRAGSVEIALMVAPRPYRYPDGVVRDFIFDDLLEGVGFDTSKAILKYPGEGATTSAAGAGIEARLDAAILLAEHLAVLLLHSRAVCVAADRIAKIVSEAGAPVSVDAIAERARIGIALFEARRRVMRQYFVRLGCRLIVLTYGPGRMGELAAAWELGIPVLELQHGMIGTNCPDYHWPEFACAWRDELPLPTRIGVYGAVFSDNLLQDKFWRRHDVAIVGGAAIDRFRSFGMPRPHVPAEPLKLLFMTQATSAFAAPPILRDILAETQSGELKGLKIAIKLHPDEQRNTDAYRDVVSSAPDRCIILPNDMNPLAAMMDADAVASFNSLSLAEAIGLGIPAISILGGPTPEGFAQLFGMPSIVSVMPHVSNVGEIISALGRIRSGHAYRAKLTSFSGRLYSSGFHGAVARVMSELLTR